MDTKDTTNKSQGNWTMNVEEIFIKHGITPKEVKKKGSVIMPATKRKERDNK